MDKRIIEANEFLDSNRDKSYVLLSSNLSKVVISAPHAVEQLRNGFIKGKEEESGQIAYILNKVLGVSSIIKTKNCNDDANSDPQSAYRDALSKFIDDNDIRYLLDLHQLNVCRPMDIDLGINGYENFKDRSLLDEIISIFNRHGIANIAIDAPFNASGLHTVSRDIALRNGIETIQIEINSRLVWHKDGVEYSKYFDVVDSLKEIVLLLDSVE